jgi:hypothetical protein
MADYELAGAIRDGARVIAQALHDQKPKMVIVPLIFAGPITAEQAHQITMAVKQAFEEALK